jgi:FKBP-type peptidyl-prolyl cis-trans isomerase (trigger factor)
MWRDYVSRMQMTEERLVEALRSQGRTLEDLRKDWTPAAEKRARLQVVVSEISKKEGIGLEEGELEGAISRMAESRGIAPAELKDNLSRNKLMDFMKNSLKMDKLNDFLLSKTVTRKGPRIKLLDLLPGK